MSRRLKAPRRFLVPPEAGGTAPPVAIYHVVSRVVDRQFVFGSKEKEHLRLLLRMYERFSGCHILSHCLMSNHIHVLLEVPPGCEKGERLDLTDEELIHRLGGLYSRNHTALVARELEAARALIAGKTPEGEVVPETEVARRRRMKKEGEEWLHEIHAPHSDSPSESSAGRRPACPGGRRS
ncbi:MAG: transposase [Phaeobacter gallaeciensis]